MPGFCGSCPVCKAVTSLLVQDVFSAVTWPCKMARLRWVDSTLAVLTGKGADDMWMGSPELSAELCCWFSKQGDPVLTGVWEECARVR